MLKPSNQNGEASAAAASAPPQVKSSSVQFWSGATIAEACQTPVLAAFLERWTQLAAKGIPRLNEILEGTPDAAMAQMQIALRVGNDFLCTYQGSGAIRVLGRNFRGVLHKEIDGSAAQEISWLYASCLDHGKPIYFRYISRRSKNHVSIEQIAVPVAGDDSRKPLFMISVIAPMDDKRDLLRAIFEHSVIGMIAAMPAGGQGDKAPDGPIVLINPRARKLIKLPAAVDRLLYIHDIAPWLRDGAMWERVESVRKGTQTEVRYLDRVSGLGYKMTIEQVERFMLFSIEEMHQPVRLAPARPADLIAAGA